MEDINAPIPQNVLDTIGNPYAERQLTLQELRGAIPARFSKAVDQKFVDHLNSLSKDPDESAYIKDNFLSFANVLNEGKFKLEDYTNAVKYLSFLMLNHTKGSAYSKTFPDRYKRLVDAGKDQRYISSYVSAYDSNLLITELRKQTLVPIYIHNRALMQQAINVQAKEMLDPKNTAFIRITASKNLLDALKEPAEVSQLNIAVNTGHSDNSAVDALTTALTNLTNAQVDAVKNGEITSRQVAELDIEVAEFTEVEE